MADTSNVEYKTSQPTDNFLPDPDKLVKLSKNPQQNYKNNILNSYRSYTYNFTLAAINVDQVGDPTSYMNAPLTNIVLKSGGKGPSDSFNIIDRGANTRTALQGIPLPDETGETGPIRRNPETGELYNSGDLYSNSQPQLDTDDIKKTIEGFKQNSGGRFDMYIDNVEMTNLGTFNPDANTTLNQGLNFTVIEPYSINGFIESLQINALAAGYLNYREAVFVLKLDFIGYPDNVDLPTPEIVKQATRYFNLVITDVNLEISEGGSKYSVKAISVDTSAKALPNKLKNPIKINGNTVGAILKDLVANVNKQLAEDNKNVRANSSEIKNDIYDIKFPVWNETERKWIIDKGDNEIASKKVREILKDKTLYAFEDPQTTKIATAADKGNKKIPTPEENAETPQFLPLGKASVQFPNGANISDCIAAIIRDSEYLKEILQNVKDKVDSNGFIDYFLISTKKEYLNSVDLQANRKFQKITFYVTPYKLHYTSIPTYRSIPFDGKTLDAVTNRKYNYVFTGKNVDILSFRLNFDLLYFEAIPPAHGYSNYVPSKDAAGPNNSTRVQLNDNLSSNITGSQVPVAPTEKDGTLNIGAQSSLNAGPLQMTQWDILARNMHNAIINSNKSLQTAEIEIIGDPFYLVTSSVGGFNPSTDVNRSITETGEAAINNREIIIRLDFKNPVDIGPDGFMKFDPRGKPAFSGYYTVAEIRNSFKEGKFTQTLKCLRKPAQIVEENLTPVAIEDRIKVSLNQNDQLVADTSPPIKDKNSSSRARELLGKLQQLSVIASDPKALIASQVNNLAKTFIDNATAQSQKALDDVNKTKNEISSKINGVTTNMASFAAKIGLTSENLKTVGPKVLAGLTVIDQLLPKNLNLSAARSQGISFENIPAAKLKNIPITAPYKTAPSADIPIKDLVDTSVASGAAGLARSVGVKNVNQIPNSRIDPSVLAATLTAAPKAFNNPLITGANQNNSVNQVLSATKNLSTAKQVSNSVEVNLKYAQVEKIETGVTEKYGSKAASPLSKLNLKL